MKNNIRKSLHFIEQQFSNLETVIKGKQSIQKASLIAYYGYGNNKFVTIEGRVIKNRGITESKLDDTTFTNIERMYKRFNSIELPGIQITATYGKQILNGISDEEGYFKFKFPFKSDLKNTKPWKNINLKFTEGQGIEVNNVAWALIPDENANFGVISDIDDTIIQTGATNIFKSIATTFSKNASTRLPFRGVTEFYRGLQKEKSPSPTNPIFYLSNSPWNLFDFIDEFITLKKIPKGPLLLRDWGIDDKKLLVDDKHKINTIIKLLNTYPTLSFILIGDSGEKDPEYYREIAHQFPKRIIAIYIRDVSEAARAIEVKQIVKEVALIGIPMLLMKNTFKAAEHAETMQWISKETVALVKDACYN